MNRDRLLGAVSAAQLTTGILGLAVALKRRHPYDVPLLHGRPDRVAQDSVLMGTALSAPLYMVAPQWVATRRLLRGAGSPSDRVLGGLGAAMVAGYFGEALVRRRLQRSSYDAVETPLVVVAISLSGAMAVLGLTPRSVGQ
jgi:hypothetical protein